MTGSMTGCGGEPYGQSGDFVEEYHGEPLNAAQKAALAEKKNQLYVGLLQNMGEADLSEEVRKTMDTLRSRGRKLAIGSSEEKTPN